MFFYNLIPSKEMIEMIPFKYTNSYCKPIISLYKYGPHKYKSIYDKDVKCHTLTNPMNNDIYKFYVYNDMIVYCPYKEFQYKQLSDIDLYSATTIQELEMIYMYSTDSSRTIIIDNEGNTIKLFKRKEYNDNICFISIGGIPYDKYDVPDCYLHLISKSFGSLDAPLGFRTQQLREYYMSRVSKLNNNLYIINNDTDMYLIPKGTDVIHTCKNYETANIYKFTNDIPILYNRNLYGSHHKYKIDICKHILDNVEPKVLQRGINIVYGKSIYVTKECMEVLDLNHISNFIGPSMSVYLEKIICKNMYKYKEISLFYKHDHISISYPKNSSSNKLVNKYLSSNITKLHVWAVKKHDGIKIYPYPQKGGKLYIIKGSSVKRFVSKEVFDKFVFINLYESIYPYMTDIKFVF